MEACLAADNKAAKSERKILLDCKHSVIQTIIPFFLDLPVAQQAPVLGSWLLGNINFDATNAVPTFRLPFMKNSS